MSTYYFIHPSYGLVCGKIVNDNINLLGKRNFRFKAVKNGILFNKYLDKNFNHIYSSIKIREFTKLHSLWFSEG